MVDKTLAMRASQTKAINERVQHINTILHYMKTNGIKPKNLTHISEYLACKLSDIEGVACSASTIRRNISYRMLVEKFMVQTGYRTTTASDKADLSLQLRVYELEQENSALKRNLSELLSREASTAGSTQASATASCQSFKATSNIINICRVVFSLLEQLDGYDIDLNNGEVTDNLNLLKVFNRSEFPEFFEWYENNSNL